MNIFSIFSKSSSQEDTQVVEQITNKIDAQSISTKLSSIVSLFSTTINNLENVKAEALKKINDNKEEIAYLESENSSLEETSEKANRIMTKLLELTE